MMDQQLPGQCHPRSPLLYIKGPYVYLIAGMAYQPTYWIATSRMNLSDSQIEQFVIGLSYEEVRDVLDRFSQTPPSANHVIDESDLERELIGHIKRRQVKVYRMSSIHYAPQLLDIDNHLTADCSIVDTVTHQSEEDLLHRQLKLSQELSTILSARWSHKIMVDDIFWAEPWYARAFIVTGAAMTSIGEGIAGLAKLGYVMLEGLYDANMYQLKLIGHLSKGEFAEIQRELKKLGMGTINSVEELKKQIEDGFSIIEPLLNDEKSRKILKDFLSGYIDSVPHVEKGAFAVAIPLEVLIALATMGAGVAVSASRVGMKVGQFSRRALELIIGLSRALLLRAERVVKKAEYNPRIPPGSAKPAKTTDVNKKGSSTGSSKKKTTSATEDKNQITALVKAGNIEEARKLLKPHLDAARNAKTPDQKAAAMKEIIDRLDVTSDKPKAFWSGDKKQAGIYAQKNGKTILEQTPGGSVIDDWDELGEAFTWDKNDMGPHGWDFWGEVSEKYSMDASGSVDIIQTKGKFPEGGPTWRNYEYEAIRKSGKVTELKVMRIDNAGNVDVTAKLDPYSDSTMEIFGLNK